MYSILLSGDERKMATPGTNKTFVKRELSHDDYMASLYVNGRCHYVKTKFVKF